MPRLVVDSNYLTKDGLRAWLKASKKNLAILTDQAEFEMIKAATIGDFLKSTAVISDFPGQVVLAKSITTASTLRGKKKGLKKRLTDGKRTRAFRKWCKRRTAIEAKKETFKHHEAQASARQHIEDLVEGGASFQDDLAKHTAEHYTAAELAIIRSGEPWTNEITKKVLDGIMDFALKFFALHPDWEQLPEVRTAPYTFIFRYALCAYLHALHWLHVGGGRGRKGEKFANDFIDVAFAAYATCFDGFLSEDKLAMSIYKNAQYLLDSGYLREDLMPTIQKKSKEIEGRALAAARPSIV